MFDESIILRSSPDELSHSCTCGLETTRSCGVGASSPSFALRGAECGHRNGEFALYSADLPRPGWVGVGSPRRSDVTSLSTVAECSTVSLSAGDWCLVSGRGACRLSCHLSRAAMTHLGICHEPCVCTVRALFEFRFL